MKKAGIAVAAMFVVALCAVAYAQQQNTYTVTGSTNPTRTGSSSRPVPVSIRFAYQVGEASGNRPSPVRRYSIRFTGLRVNTNAFPSCSASRLENQGPDSCPRGSAVGSGFITNATGARDNPADRSIACNAKLTVFNSGNNRATIYVEGSPQATDPRQRCAIELASPIPARYVRRGSAMALEFDVPASLLHPLPTLDNAVTSVTSTIRRVTRRRRGRTVGYYESTGGCRNGRRTISVVFTPESGPPSTASTTARCSR
jgi:hypothetical protein